MKEAGRHFILNQQPKRPMESVALPIITTIFIPQRRNEPLVPKVKLSPMETNILKALAEEGLDKDAIADKLTRSPNTIKKHLRNICEKTEMRTVLELVSFAFTHGYAQPRTMLYEGQALTVEEVQILQDIAKGENNETIGLYQGVSEQTAGKYIGKLFGKMSVHSRLEAVSLAWKTGLLRENIEFDDANYDPTYPGFTRQEIAILRSALEGSSHETIALTLGLSQTTVARSLQGTLARSGKDTLREAAIAIASRLNPKKQITLA